MLLCREENINPREPLGSYAGAMGYPQFMPSSYRALAKDFENDGHRDIWKNPRDAIASVANYFEKMVGNVINLSQFKQTLLAINTKLF